MNESDYRGVFDFTGKTAIITGGAGILGPQFAAGLLQNGARVAIIDVDEEATRKTTESLARTHGDRIAGFICDVADPEAVAGMVREVAERFGEIHILLNNAGYFPDDFDAFFAPFEEYTLEQWRKVMAVNIDAMFLVAQAVGRAMIRQRSGGTVIQISSIYGVLSANNRIYEGSEYLGSPINNPAAYSASKAAVIGLTRWLATYWAKHNIRVNAIAPGGVESGQNETFQRRYGQRVPLGRMARPEEIVSTVLYLASDATSYVTGQCLLVDGGLSAW